MRRFVPCPQCKRHVRATETTCPHCGKTGGVLTFAALTMTAGLALAGCDPVPAAVYGPPPVDPGARSTATATESAPPATVYGPPALSPDDRVPPANPTATDPGSTATSPPSTAPTAPAPPQTGQPTSAPQPPPVPLYGPPPREPAQRATPLPKK